MEWNARSQKSMSIYVIVFALNHNIRTKFQKNNIYVGKMLMVFCNLKTLIDVYEIATWKNRDKNIGALLFSFL